MQLCFFSDELSKNFLPLTLTRPVFDLRIGILTICEKWEKVLSLKYTSGILDPHLAPVFKNKELNTDQNCIWINSRVLPTKELSDAISSLPEQSILFKNNLPIAAKVNGEESLRMIEENHFLSEAFTRVALEIPISSITYLWDLLSKNEGEIKNDIQLLGLHPISQSGMEYDDTIILGHEQLYISESAKIEPGCILIAEKGPIYIGPNTTIEAGSILKGPVAVCEEATVKMRARIYDATTIGPVCKVGGEVSNSIFHSYSNKAHDGFTGSSLIGQWCNFGADTNTSNLKNSYAEVKIFDWNSKIEYEKGFQFFGTILGDHSKTAINTVLNTGTTCGVSSNIFSLGFPPRYIPSFQWMGQEKTVPYEFDKAIIAMRAMMKRRGVELTEEYINMMKSIAGD